MLFSSITFLFLFLPILTILYYVFPKKFRNMLLLLASIIFYGWGEPVYLLLMFLVGLINYLGARIILNVHRKKLCISLLITLNLCILFYFKYFNFLLRSINELFSGNIAFANIALLFQI